jgi:hypothetical protein
MKKHECIATRVNNLIVFKCPYCDYELIEDLDTGKVKIKNIKFDINHSGCYNGIKVKGVNIAKRNDSN